MAGGYHLFSTGEILTAANVDNYLMNQTVMVFASAAARTTALSGVLAEGMISYRTDSHITEYYNGTAWATLGSVLTTKGDLATYDTAAARLAVGADGTTLVANSSAATGLSYQPLNSAGKNAIINGGMDIWQRGTSVALAASAGVTYLADRFCTNTGANEATTISRQATGDTTNLPNIQYALRYQRNSGQTGTTAYTLISALETVNSIPLAGKQVTLSFYARAGANYSSASNLLGVSIISSTGTDQNPFLAWAGSATPVSTSSTLTTTWQRFTATGTIAATATQLALQIQFTPVGTAGANDYFEITGVQLELGSVATTFSRAGGTLQGELAACQRYYQRWTGFATGSYIAGFGMASSTTSAIIHIDPPSQLRIPASQIDFSNLSLFDGVTGTTVTAVGSVGTVSENIFSATVASGLTQYRSYHLISQGGTIGYIGFTAEL